MYRISVSTRPRPKWKGPELPSRPKGRDTAGRLPWPALSLDGRVSRAGGFEPDLCSVGTSVVSVR